MQKEIELTQKDGVWTLTMPEEKPAAGTASLEAGKWFDKEVMGVPVMPGLIGGSVAELSAALVAKVPQLAALTGGNQMLTDLLIAAALGWVGKKHEWAKYGAMFMVYAAFQPSIQNLVGQITNGINIGGQQQAAAAPAGMAQDPGDINAMTPAEVQSWMNS